MHRKWLTITLMMVTVAFLVGVVPASAAPNKDSVVHIVQPGETLYSIARRYGVNMWTIASTNGITNPNRIYVGQRLVIPTGRPVGNVHVVQAGETLLRIALRYGVDAWAIARVNGISNLNHIYVGQRLVIPGAAPPVKPPPAQPVSPVSWPGPWSGEYFDNVSLSGSAYLTREDESINFNWEWGPPAGGMPTNNFSVRWTGTFYFDEGTYRFYTQVDDGVRVYVDDELIISSWRDGGFRLYSKDCALSAGNHSVRVEYYDRTQVARIHFWWKAVSWTAPTATPGPAPSAGWLGEFFNNEDLAGDPVVTRQDAWIAFDWGTGSPVSGIWEEGFSARWTTNAQFKTDHYRFCARSDDGARIWVDGHLVLDEWHANAGTTYCGDHWLGTGTYKVEVEYYEHGGDALVYVWWEPH
jgi:LysM repeat protein